MTGPPKPSAFVSDTDYLAAEFEWLRTRVERLTAERSEAQQRRVEAQREPSQPRPGREGARELHLRVLELREQERKQRELVDARLLTHRTGPLLPTLGLDKLCKQHGLSADERLLLLALCVPGAGPSIAEEVLFDLPSFHGRLAVSDALLLLGCRTVTDWVEQRRLFRHDAPLLAAHLVELDSARGIEGPESLLGCDLRITQAAWGVLVGDVASGRELRGVGEDEP